MIPAGGRRVLAGLCTLSIPHVALAGDGADVVAVELWMAVPFAALLLSIAVVPFINRHWWEKSYIYIAFGLAAVTIGYYLLFLGNGDRLLTTASEYFSFICLIGSLFVVSGGIHIKIKGKSKPLANVFFLAAGSLMANVVGTTGASMILIRPYLRVNKYRIKPFHVVFFIFMVSNMGGALTPIGDPPLFLGYLKGIPFFWVAEHLWYKWLIVMVAILGIFYVIDARSYNRLPQRVRQSAEGAAEEGEAEGVHNVFFLLIILVAVFVTKPPFLREVLMIGAAIGSFAMTKKEVHQKNEFNFIPIKEVAILFFGIFATMVPALDWLHLNASKLGIVSVSHFYWVTGALSAFLDNAPTYLNFLTAAMGLFVNEEIVKQVQQLVVNHGATLSQLSGPYAVEVKNTFTTLVQHHYDLVLTGQAGVDKISIAYLLGNHSAYVLAISLAAVFFGALTYIGNGPNFMVKSIAEQSGVHCPSFFGYMVKYSLPVLVPLFFLVWLAFFFE
jgi:Na+/H+ antiporter NhaD/arsenite permease-like protein